MPTASELPINTSASAIDMADAIFGNGISIVSATYTGSANASGIYSNGDAVAPGVTPSDTGVILSTGSAESITNSSGDANAVAGRTTSNNTAGDADLSEISGQTTFDAAVLEATFVPSGSTLTMQVVFSSEEYLEYVNSGFNDAVGIWVNGEPAELQVGSGNISIDEINDSANENLYIDNPASQDLYNTEMDGFTVTLTLKAPVNPGVENTIKIGIADGGDRAYDSNLLIAGDSVQTTLVAGDDELEMPAGGSQTFDLLANDVSSTGSTLTITEINGQPVVVGDTITLATGEQITLTETGIVLVDPDDEVGENSFTYKVADEDGNTDVALVKLTTTTPPCFTLGTLIQTVKGAVPVEDLSAGDLVMTLDHGPRPLRWIGRSTRTATGRDAPVRIARGVLGEHSALELSPQHRILFSSPIASLHFGSQEVLVKAKDLQPVEGVGRREDGRPVTYFHLLFDQHEIINGNGLWSESYQAGAASIAGFDTESHSELMRLFPLLAERSQIWSQADARTSLKEFEAKLLLCEAVLDGSLSQLNTVCERYTAASAMHKPSA